MTNYRIHETLKKYGRPDHNDDMISQNLLAEVTLGPLLPNPRTCINETFLVNASDQAKDA
jgi:hypothetical protein